MVKPTASGCINHPAIEAVARCKQCGKPVCGACLVTGPTGRFCSDTCKDKHEKFIGRAQDMQRNARSTGTLTKVISLATKLVILLVAVGFLGFIAAYLNLPVVGGPARQVLSYVPFVQGLL